MFSRVPKSAIIVGVHIHQVTMCGKEDPSAIIAGASQVARCS